MNPGRDGDCAVVRWTCPERGGYTINASFRGLDNNADNSDPEVHILKNLEILRQAKLRDYRTGKEFTLPQDLQVDDALDFVVSQGLKWGNDSVGLQLRITRTS
jgi:hypothetical protein